MRKYLAVLLLLGVACSQNSSGQNSTNINPNQVPDAVKAAFSSEHPYAQMGKPVQEATVDSQTTYTIPYTRTDGSKGLVTYTSFGELKSDE